MTPASSNGIIKEVMPKRKRFTVLSVQLAVITPVDSVDPDSEVTVSSSFVHVLAMDAETASSLVAESLEQGSTVVAVIPGYTQPAYIRS